MSSGEGVKARKKVQAQTRELMARERRRIRQEEERRRRASFKFEGSPGAPKRPGLRVQ